MSDQEPFYTLEGRFTKLGPIGLVSDGLRMDNEFAGRLRGGPLDGAELHGVDYFRIRPDGIGIVNARESIQVPGARIAASVTGYVVPPKGMTLPSAEQLMYPGFEWPDAPFAIECFATFETSAPQLAGLNRLTVVHSGFANMASRELTVIAHLVTQSTSPAKALATAAAA